MGAEEEEDEEEDEVSHTTQPSDGCGFYIHACGTYTSSSRDPWASDEISGTKYRHTKVKLQVSNFKFRMTYQVGATADRLRNIADRLI